MNFKTLSTYRRLLLVVHAVAVLCGGFTFWYNLGTEGIGGAIGGGLGGGLGGVAFNVLFIVVDFIVSGSVSPLEAKVAK
ncbi:hypothetical protein KP803_11895 [Vibrio sp. ZSDE26]|uniref:Uncharacterized protein n=1 Tax=Vibrio amylolyticus TaxID=2847292 RepID=A0A9X1XJ48_9VIBR|nr:hypothetical protein [Vibrio amylolyticus]MCK6263972.1 hypothetical protein [Vibrio amylolyticus]